MGIKVLLSLKKMLHSCTGSPQDAEEASPAVDLREEYANAFRTESYDEFWARVLDLTSRDPATCSPVDSTAAARLPSYRLFAESLLDPDQSTVTNILGLARAHIRPQNHSLLSEYFYQTANASLLCGLLLKDIEQIRLQYHPLKTTLHSPANCSPATTYDELHNFATFLNPFGSSAPSLSRFKAMRANWVSLLKRLELSRKNSSRKLWLAMCAKASLAVILVAATVLLAMSGVCIAAKMFVLSFSVPCFGLAPSTNKMARTMAQLDAAAKGTYIMSRDLDTISRLVARLDDELDHVQAMVRFYLERCGERLEPSQEVVRQLRKIDSSFSQQLDELEEHLYLCFMTINRARSLVKHEVLGLGRR